MNSNHGNADLAPCVERREVTAVHCHELRPHPAMAIDPGADFRRIEPHDPLRCQPGSAPASANRRRNRTRRGNPIPHVW